MTANFDRPPSWADLSNKTRAHGLWPLGGFSLCKEDGLPERFTSLVLLAPQDDAFWPLFTASVEFGDGQPDPLDRWSRRVIGKMACELGAKALFPFSGPPWRPFIAWALRTGRVHQSPVGMLVSQEAGLFFSVRGALALTQPIALPAPASSPCDTCADRPCLSACPVGALGATGYDTATCRTFLDTEPGTACMAQGCAVRRACPSSRAWPRSPAQSAFHMRAFQGTT